jgi:hypothetical protein
MAAATLTGTQAASSFPLGGAGGAFAVQASVGTVTVDASTEDGDIFKVCRVPAGATVIGGWVIAGDGDTGIEALDIDIGWAANGVDAADPDGLGNLGTWTGDASSGGTTEAINHLALGGVLATAGPKTFTADTTIQLETNTAATTGAAMEVTVVVLYLYQFSMTPATAPV